MLPGSLKPPPLVISSADPHGVKTSIVPVKPNARPTPLTQFTVPSVPATNATRPYCRAWLQERKDALIPEQQRSPLGKVPYQLRHAAVSLWLNAGVPATQVAEWAGYIVNVLLKVYAKCID